MIAPSPADPAAPSDPAAPAAFDSTGSDPSGSADAGSAAAASTGPVDDAVLAMARRAAEEEAGTAERVGEFLDVQAEDDVARTLSFAALDPGYRGWRWSVTVAQVGQDAPTVSEVLLLPGSQALVPPPWLPWSERIRGQDVGPGDLLPPAPDDERLVPGYLQSDDPAVEDVALEVGLGRRRVLGVLGRLDAAERWHAGEFGPETPMAEQAPASCISCGFYLPLAGSLGAALGACANELSPADGRVVDAAFGCGAHSETEIDMPMLSAAADVVLDDGELDLYPRGAGRRPADVQDADEAGGDEAGGDAGASPDARGGGVDSGAVGSGAVGSGAADSGAADTDTDLVDSVAVDADPVDSNAMDSTVTGRASDAGGAGVGDPDPDPDPDLAVAVDAVGQAEPDAVIAGAAGVGSVDGVGASADDDAAGVADAGEAAGADGADVEGVDVADAVLTVEVIPEADAVSRVEAVDDTPDADTDPVVDDLVDTLGSEFTAALDTDDSATDDSATDDSATVDTATVDTATVDTGAADIAAADTDTDTGADSDTGAEADTVAEAGGTAEADGIPAEPITADAEQAEPITADAITGTAAGAAGPDGSERDGFAPNGSASDPGPLPTAPLFAVDPEGPAAGAAQDDSA